MPNVNAFFPDYALVEIAKKDDAGSGLTVTTQVSNWSESGFGRPSTSDPYFGNAKVKYQEPDEDGEVSFDVAVTNAQWYRLFHGGTGSDFTSGSAQPDYRVTVLVRDSQVSVGSVGGFAQAGLAAGSVTGSGNALRVIYANATLASFEPEMSADEYLKGTITFNVTPTDENGFGNVRIQEKEANIGSRLAALGSFTSLAKW